MVKFVILTTLSRQNTASMFGLSGDEKVDLDWPYDNILLILLCITQQSKKNVAIGAVEIARKQGIVAVYLNIAAIVSALVVACFVIGLTLGLYGRYSYYP